MTLTGFPHPCTSQLLYNCHDFSWFPSSVCSHISEVVRSMFNYKTSSLQTNNWILRDHFKMVFFCIMEKKLKKKNWSPVCFSPSINISGVGPLHSYIPQNLSTSLTWVIKDAGFHLTADFSLSFWWVHSCCLQFFFKHCAIIFLPRVITAIKEDKLNYYFS